jgi:TonB-dependent SusC/RagA subfamily outer membrane receptor
VRNQPSIYLDGIRVTEMTTSGGGTNILELIPADDVERIQVLRGPSADAYLGADAMNGVIVIETRGGRQVER